MKKFEITKEQILETFEATSVHNQEQLKQWFPQAFESELEVGKWYKGNRGVLAFCRKTKSNTDFYGYGFGYDDRTWCDENEITWYCDKWELATDKEVETALIKEAKRRGFKEGVGYIDHLGDKNIADHNPKKFFDNFDILHCGRGQGFIFKNGKWATISEQPLTLTIDEIAEKFGTTADKIKICK